MKWFRVVAIACIMFAWVLQTTASARPVPAWSYEILFRKSDLVVIVEPTAVRNATKEDKLVPPFGETDEYFSGTITSFRVLAVPKGEFADKSISIKHFVLTEKGRRLGNGPVAISFESALRDPAKPKQFLIFLKKLPSGDVEFVTGQVDSAFSVKRLTDAPIFGW